MAFLKWAAKERSLRWLPGFRLGLLDTINIVGARYLGLRNKTMSSVFNILTLFSNFLMYYNIIDAFPKDFSNIFKQLVLYKFNLQDGTVSDKITFWARKDDRSSGIETFGTFRSHSPRVPYCLFNTYFVFMIEFDILPFWLQNIGSLQTTK